MPDFFELEQPQHHATNCVISPELAMAQICPPVTSPADHPAEIGGMVSLAHFRALGIPDPEALAARLAHRDNDLDCRRLCLECRHLSGHAQGAWHCNNWSRAGMLAIRAVHAQLPAELVMKLQRCDGFDVISNPET